MPEGIEVGKWVASTAGGVKAFYDIDTPITLAKLEDNRAEYISRELIPKYDIYRKISADGLHSMWVVTQVSIDLNSRVVEPA